MGKQDRKHSDLTFLDSIGQKATVKRETLGAEAAAIPNRKLCDLGRELNPLPLTELEYRGSAAVHIFVHERLNQMFFISQTDPLVLYKCPELIASKAFDDLLGTMKQTYQKRRSKLRSGF